MAVDPAFWDAFHEAQDALFSALRESASLRIQPLLLSPSADRAALRAAVASVVADLEQTRGLVESIEKKCSRMGLYVHETIARA